MGIYDKEESHGNVNNLVRINNTLVQTVDNSMSQRATIHCLGVKRLFIQMTVAIAALTGFQIRAKATPTAPESILYSTTGDFTVPTGILIGTSGDLSAQGIGTGWFILDVGGVDSVDLYAQSGGTATLVFFMGGS